LVSLQGTSDFTKYSELLLLGEKLLAVQEGLYVTDLVANNLHGQNVSMLSMRFSAHEMLKAIGCETFMQLNQNTKLPAVSISYECEVQI